MAGPEDPHGDLAPVGDQDLLECLAHISFLLLSAGRRESFGRWDDNSDASLDVVKMNGHNLYKDRIRTWELQARVAMNKKN